MKRAVNPITEAGVLLSAVFIALVYFFPQGQIHEIMNGIFVAVAVIVALVFRKVTVDTILGRGEYGRAQRMALGLALLWLAFNIRTLQSIVYRATDNAQWLIDLPTGALVTYLAIIAGWLQATSPGFRVEPGYLHGQSRTWLVFAVSLGVFVGVGVIWLQRSAALRSLLASTVSFFAG